MAKHEDAGGFSWNYSHGLLVIVPSNTLSMESAEHMETFSLEELASRDLEGVLIDMSRLLTIDSLLAKKILSMTAAIRVMGKKVALTGVSGELALSLVTLNLNFDTVTVVRDTDEAIRMLKARK